ncbi:hypothetical protein [Caulobacter segnis]
MSAPSPAPSASTPPAARVRRPAETEAARARRLRNLAVRLADREHRAKTALAALNGALPRSRGHVTPLDEIDDEVRRLQVWKARVERLEALLDATERKRETRAKIVLGGALLAEATESEEAAGLMARVLDILDRRVARPRDRLALVETLGLAIEPLPNRAAATLPDFDALAMARLARETPGVEATPRTRRRKKEA